MLCTRRTVGRLLISGAAVLAAGPAGLRCALAAGAAPVEKLRISLLSTMLADRGLGEWGFAALVETGKRRVLYDTGAHPDAVLSNAKDLKVDLSGIEDVVISHNHADHVGGLLTLRREFMTANPRALATAHVGTGIFIPRLDDDGHENNGLSKIRAGYQELGGHWVQHDKPAELEHGVWFTGPVPRIHDERNWSPGLHLSNPKADAPGIEDDVPEDSALVFDTRKGLVVLTGCGHAGIVNICELARARVRKAPIEAVIGGLHLFRASDAKIAWTAAQLKGMNVRNLLAAHCTGIEATYKLRDGLGLDRRTAAVGAVGSYYDLEDGVHAGDLAG